MRVCAAILALVCATPAWPQGDSSVEYPVKAAFLYNFARFIEWPAEAFPNEKSPIALCVFRHDPFGSALDEVLRGKSINNRELQARRVNELPALKTCQVIFISGQEDKHLPEVLITVKGASALIVGESGEFAERGGTIQFYLEDNKLRFAVNLDAAQRARLQVSSRLLALAKIVRDGGHPKSG
jgi:hypothetical protein